MDYRTGQKQCLPQVGGGDIIIVVNVISSYKVNISVYTLDNSKDKSITSVQSFD